LKELPSVSVCIATFNSGKTLDRCLKLIRNQNYPQSKIEIILGDGGSTDKTIELAKKYKAKLVRIPPKKQHAEYNRGVAFNKAQGELVLVLDHDNFLPNKNWLLQMLKPLQENPKMVAVTTERYHYSKRYGLIDRYFALMGSSEPLPFFLKKADRISYLDDKWRQVDKVEERKDYYIAYFENKSSKIPSIGTNGCLMRRKVVSKYADVRPDYHYPIDVMVDVVKNGHNQFGIAKNSIIHLTGARGFIKFLTRRKEFVEKYHFEDNSKRRWSVVMPEEKGRVVFFVIYSLTLVKPMSESIRGFLKIQDIAWFLHPVMCVATTFIYGYVSVKFFIAGKFR